MKLSEAMREHLYSEELGRFLRSLQANNGDDLTPDATIDASLFGIFYFDVFDIDDEVVKNTMKAVEKHLWVEGKIGGIARFNDDGYMRVSNDFTGNAWFICTLWLADYRIAVAKKKVGFERRDRNSRMDGEKRSAFGSFSRTSQSFNGRTCFGFAAHLVAFDICGNGCKLFKEISMKLE